MPFQAWHLDYMRLQNSQMALSPLLTLAYGLSLESAGPAYSAVAGMDVIACAGVVEFWTGRSQVWALLSEQMPQYRKTIHKAVKTYLAKYGVARLECVVDPRSETAIRWAERLGFHVEHLMKAYTPQGEDQLMMVRLEQAGSRYSATAKPRAAASMSEAFNTTSQSPSQRQTSGSANSGEAVEIRK